MTRTDKPVRRAPRIALVGNYLPRKCGIATFTTDTRNALVGRYPDMAIDVFAMEDGAESRVYPPEVAGTIRQDHLSDYLDIARRINEDAPDALWLQHEYGIFGGPGGDLILRLLDRVTAPVVATLHTVLADPTPDQRRVLDAILARASRVIVMAEMGKRLLEEVHGVEPSRIAVIPHGIPDRPFVDPSDFKPRFGFEGKRVLLTFGLLSPNKGLETMIEALPAVVKKHPDALYVILGATHPHLIAQEGEAYREGLARQAASLGVSDNVRFINAFVDNDILLDYLAAADIYVTPYLNPAQVTSGTLSYAIGLGKPVVSTPYWHAAELLADEHGILVPFGKSAAIAGAINELLDNPALCATIRKRAYSRGRTMIWPRVAEAAVDEIASGIAETPVRLPASVNVPRKHPVAPDLTAVERMSDDCGIFQHGLFVIPNRDHGYCVDDNARALMLMHRVGRAAAGRADQLAVIYASFVQHAWNAELGRFRNFMAYNRSWLEEAGSEDSCGRSLWSLGVTADEARPRELRTWASSLFDQAAGSAFELRHPRATAFAMLGAVAMGVAHPGHALSRRILKAGGDHLRGLLASNRREGWYWFENNLSYDNARLPQALIRAGIALGDDGMVADGLAALEWLNEIQTAPGGYFRAVGTDSFGREMRPPLPFDQQPLEAVATIEACAAALDGTGEARWLERAERAYAWYLGENDLGLPIATIEDGGCHDGLMPDRINMNQGAESILSFQLACCAMIRLKAGSDRLPLSKMAAE